MLHRSDRHVDVIRRATAIVQRRISPRPAPVEIILYKSVGSARHDITVAELCLTRARTLGLGSRLRNTIEPVAT
jgi:ornithine cyclodeaminase/alanine dehydrogenase-like protein (mu-crystallin family)